MKKGDFIWGGALLAVIALLIVPITNQFIISATKASPYIMGFIKFAILATMGELLAIRILSKNWKAPNGLLFRAIVWGVIGIVGTPMFQFYPAGMMAIIKNGLFFQLDGKIGIIVTAFFTSTIMNLTFTPMFMAAHRISDYYIDSKYKGEKISVSEIIGIIDWSGFIKFVVLKTIPFFWIPVHTITLLLPSEYRVIFAALLSIVLGAILSYAKRRNINKI